MSTPRVNVFSHFCELSDKSMTLEQVFDNNVIGLNYKVEEQPIMRVSPAFIEQWGKLREANEFGFGDEFNPTELLGLLLDMDTNNIISEKKATYRSDNNHTFNVVGKGYTIVQNRAAFDFFNDIEQAAGKQPQIIAAGALNGGARMFMTCRMGDDFELGAQGDIVTPYIIFTTTHDGSGGVVAMVSPVRAICQNTLNMALHCKASQRVTIRHTKNAHDRLTDALKVIKMSNSFTAEFVAAMDMLRKVEVTEADMRRFVGDVLLKPAQYVEWEKANFNIDNISKEVVSTRTKNMVNGLLTSIESGIGQGYYRGSALWLANGLTTYLQTDKPRSKNFTQEDEFLSFLEGTDADYIQQGYNALLRMPAVRAQMNA